MNSLALLPALPYTLALVAGVVVSYFVPLCPLWLAIAAMALCIVVALIVRRHRRGRCYPLLAACFFLGSIAMTTALARTHVALPAERVSIEGTVVAPPRPTASRQLLTVYVLRGAMAGKKVRCYVRKDDVPVVLGATYVFTGRLYPFASFGDNTHFDYPRWAEAHAFVAQMSVQRGDYVRTENQLAHLPFFERLALRAQLLRQTILARIAQENLAPDKFTLIAAMAFGERSMLSQETRTLFARTGISHLLALSGLHLSIFYTLLSWLFIRLGGRSVGNVVVIVSVWIYVLLVGMPVSVVRAATMLTLCTLLGQRDRHLSANPLFVAVAIMLLCNPLMLWDVGFQMSVLSVLAISCFYSPLYQLISPLFLARHAFLRTMWAMALVSLSAQMGVFPLVIYYFGYFPTIFFLTNLIAVPLVTALLYSVFLALLFCWLPVVMHVLLWLPRLVLTLLNWFVGAASTLPGASIDQMNISFVQVVVLYGVVAAIAVAVHHLPRAYTLT